MFGEMGFQDLLTVVGVAIIGEVFTGIAKWTKRKRGLGWTILHGISSKLARMIPTFSDRGK